MNLDGRGKITHPLLLLKYTVEDGLLNLNLTWTKFATLKISHHIVFFKISRNNTSNFFRSTTDYLDPSFSLKHIEPSFSHVGLAKKNH